MAPSGSMAVEVDAIAGSVPDPAAGGKVRVTWYTDPHNVWCWGCEPMMRRLEIVYPDRVEVHLRMGGLFEDFSPVREQWARMSGGRWTASVEAFFDAVANQHRMPMDAPRMLGSVDDFDSTWPACIAAKAAEARGRDPGRQYLRALREAWCLDGRGIHRRSVQIEVAREVGLDTQAFSEALGDGSAERAFREDREVCEREKVTGFPTFEIRLGDVKARIDGWQPWEVFEDVLRQVDPGIAPKPVPVAEASVAEILRRYGRCATREVSAILGTPDDDAEILLEELEGGGKVLRHVVGGGIVWESAGGSRDRIASPP